MCDTCGCSITPGNAHLVHDISKPIQGENLTIDVLSRLMDENNRQAGHNRQHFDQHKVLAVNLMSSPGAGKTSLLEATIKKLSKSLRIAVIEGDLETENDARRIRALGVPAIQISTGQACHLDAHLLHDAVHQLDLDQVDILFIENVGNLVCPASFDLGHHANVVLLSVAEGDDKPAKYPVMFRAADLVLLSKLDYLDFVDDFDPGKATLHIRELANPAAVLGLSVRRPDTLTDWFDWLSARVTELRDGAAMLPRTQPDGVKLHAST